MCENEVICDTPLKHYGNCAMCYRKGMINTKCGYGQCEYTLLSHIIIFKNMDHQYISPDIILLVLNNTELLQQVLATDQGQ